MMDEEKNNNLPEYLREWKRDHDKSWRERWKQYYETWKRLKEDLPRGRLVERRSRQDPRAIIVGTPEWVFYEKIAEQPRIDLEEWK